MVYRRIFAAFLCGLIVIAGCESGGQGLYQDFQDEDPAVRIEAAAQAGRIGDDGSVAYLVDRLEDPESDVRFFSFLALKRITGRTMGWRYYDPPQRRTEAVERWREWLRQGRPEAPSAGEDGAHHE